MTSLLRRMRHHDRSKICVEPALPESSTNCLSTFRSCNVWKAFAACAGTHHNPNSTRSALGGHSNLSICSTFVHLSGSGFHRFDEGNFRTAHKAMHLTVCGVLDKSPLGATSNRSDVITGVRGHWVAYRVIEFWLGWIRKRTHAHTQELFTFHLGDGYLSRPGSV